MNYVHQDKPVRSEYLNATPEAKALRIFEFAESAAAVGMDRCGDLFKQDVQAVIEGRMGRDQ